MTRMDWVDFGRVTCLNFLGSFCKSPISLASSSSSFGFSRKSPSYLRGRKTGSWLPITTHLPLTFASCSRFVRLSPENAAVSICHFVGRPADAAAIAAVWSCSLKETAIARASVDLPSSDRIILPSIFFFISGKGLLSSLVNRATVLLAVRLNLPSAGRSDAPRCRRLPIHAETCYRWPKVGAACCHCRQRHCCSSERFLLAVRLPLKLFLKLGFLPFENLLSSVLLQRFPLQIQMWRLRSHRPRKKTAARNTSKGDAQRSSRPQSPVIDQCATQGAPQPASSPLRPALRKKVRNPGRVLFFGGPRGGA
ncbi:hypothetical protein ACLOJK_025875 [Asimina triloba]